MTDPTGVVYDLGYQRYDGERLGRRGALVAIFKDGMRRVLGLRRRARNKIMPWSLIVLALMPAGFFLAFSVITGELLIDGATNEPVELFGAAEYSSFSATVTLLFVALAATELLIPDRVHGTLEVYASRPLRRTDYLGARTAALAALTLAFLVVPQTLLLIGNAFVSPDGFLSSLVGDLDVLARAIAATAVYFAAFAPLAAVVAAYSNRTAVGAGVYLAIVFAVNGVSDALVTNDFDIAGLFALNHHPRYVSDWIFDDSTLQWIPERAGFEPWVSLAVVAAIAVGSGFLVLRRYRRWL